MIRNTLFIIGLAVFCACGRKNHPAGSVRAADWYAFHDGKRFNKPSDVFDVSDTLIRLYGEKPGYLMSRRSYSNFELNLEFRWNTSLPHGAGPRNSGVMYLVPDTARDVLWPAGIQFQVKQGGTGDFILLEGVTLNVRGKKEGPGKSLNVPRISDQERPVGEWNTILIKSDNGKCSQYLNGVLVNEGTEASIRNGRILLQYEGSSVDFRKLIIK